MDINGMVVNVSSFSRESTMDMSEVSAGLYILRLKTDQGVIAKKFLKHER